ncbi:hypothetical protein M758_11G107100, partial [Ceratodon purpureus]
FITLQLKCFALFLLKTSVCICPFSFSPGIENHIMYMIARIRARSGIRCTIHSPCNILFLQVCGVRRIINSLPTITVRFTSLPPSKPFTYLGSAIRAHIWSPLASSCCYHRAYHISLKSPVGTYSSCLLAMQRLGLILSSSLALTYLKCPSSGASWSANF